MARRLALRPASRVLRFGSWVMPCQQCLNNQHEMRDNRTPSSCRKIAYQGVDCFAQAVDPVLSLPAGAALMRSAGMYLVQCFSCSL